MRLNIPLVAAMLIVFFIPQISIGQEVQTAPDSTAIEILKKDYMDMFWKADSLEQQLKSIQLQNWVARTENDSLQKVISGLQAGLATANVKADTLSLQKLHVTRELFEIRQQLLTTSTALEQKLQQLRDNEYQLANCRQQMKDIESAASLSQAKLEGKNEVNSTLVAAKDREIAYQQESIREKDRIISEKTAELSHYFNEKSSSLRLVDSLSRQLNQKELELIRVIERLKIIEGQYNEMVAQKAAAANKKKKIRFVQGVGLKNYRTPDWQLAPQSSSTTSVYVITNKNGGKIEFDYITGVSLSLFDLSKPDGKFTYDAGLYLGFGGTNLFKNCYVAPSLKAFDFFHFMAGLNVAEYQQLQHGFNVGDALPGGMNIPTVKEWKANLFFGMTIDFELLSNIPKKM